MMLPLTVSRPVQIPTDGELEAMAPFAAIGALREAERAVMLKLGAVAQSADDKLGCVVCNVAFWHFFLCRSL
jgi:hypothetical protein